MDKRQLTGNIGTQKVDRAEYPSKVRVARIMKNYPIVSIEVTDRCNLHCSHCRIDTGAYEPSTKELLKVIKEVAKLSPKIIVLSGGEPLLRQDIFTVIENIRKNGSIVQLNTNGQLITDKTIAQLLETGVEYIQISLEGPRKINDLIRGKGTYDKAFAACQKVKPPIKLIINTTVSKFNLPHLRTFANDLFKNNNKLNVHLWGLKRFIPYNTLSKHLLGRDGLEKLLSIWEELKDEFDNVIIKTDTPQRNVKKASTVKRIMDKYNIQQAGCSAGITCLTIRANGDVAPCPTIYLSCGNLHKTPIEQIIDSQIIEKLKNRDSITECRNCRYREICGGCRASALKLTGNLMGNDTECYLYSARH